MNDEHENSYQSFKKDLMWVALIALVIKGFEDGWLTWKRIGITLGGLLIFGQILTACGM